MLTTGRLECTMIMVITCLEIETEMKNYGIHQMCRVSE